MNQSHPAALANFVYWKKENSTGPRVQGTPKTTRAQRTKQPEPRDERAHVHGAVLDGQQADGLTHARQVKSSRLEARRKCFLPFHLYQNK